MVVKVSVMLVAEVAVEVVGGVGAVSGMRWSTMTCLWNEVMRTCSVMVGDMGPYDEGRSIQSLLSTWSDSLAMD